MITFPAECSRQEQKDQGTWLAAQLSAGLSSDYLWHDQHLPVLWAPPVHHRVCVPSGHGPLPLSEPVFVICWCQSSAAPGICRCCQRSSRQDKAFTFHLNCCYYSLLCCYLEIQSAERNLFPTLLTAPLDFSSQQYIPEIQVMSLDRYFWDLLLCCQGFN